MSSLLTLFFLSCYAGCVSLLFTSKRQYFLYATLLLVATNDLIFVPLDKVMPPTLLLISKAWKEYFIGGLLLYNMMQRRSTGFGVVSVRVFRIAAVICVLSALGLAIGLMRSGLGDGIQQWRRYFVPLLLALLIAASDLPRRISARRAINLLIALACVMAVFSLYEYLSFTGDFTKLWYYEFVARSKESIETESRMLQYQFMRDDSLRATGFFISAIEYSLFNAMVIAYAVLSIPNTRGFDRRLRLLLVIALLLAGEVVANVRIGWVMLALTLLCALQLHVYRIRSFAKLAAMPVAMLLFSFAMIVVARTDLDASSVGRLAQYASVPAQFRPQGYGLGAITNNGETYKDSWYISVLMVFGVASVGYVWLMFSPVTKALRRLGSGPQSGLAADRAAYTMALGTISLSIAQLYVFGFHYSTGLSHLYVVQIFMFLVWFRLLEKPEPAPEQVQHPMASPA